MERERRHKEAAQLQELRDMLSCAKSEQQALRQKEAEHVSHLVKIPEVTSRHLETLGGERRPEDLSGRCVAEAHESDCLER